MPASQPSQILIVDDEPKAVTLLCNLLVPEGYRVLTAGSAAEALEVAAREMPDLVLLDVMMPGTDGFELCTQMRKNPRLAHLPIIMLTALDDRKSLLRGIEVGADDFLAKPFDSTELRIRLRTITRLNRFRLLYEERARFELAVVHNPQGIVLAELDGQIIHHNKAFTWIVAGNAPAPDNFFAFLPADAATKLRQHLANVCTWVELIECTLRRPEQPDAIVEISCTLIPWHGRSIAHFVVHDLTERRQLEQQLLQSQRIEVLGQLAGSAIHDVNNLLSAIHSSAQLLELKGGANYEVHVQDITRSTQRCASILRQLLLFGRGGEGGLEEVNAAIIAYEVAQIAKDTFGKSHQVTFRSEANLPSVKLDSTQVHQIVLNLCVNARDAMPNGGPIVISVDRQRIAAPLPAVLGDRIQRGDYVTISVRDTGTGISPEVLPKLFEPFFTTKPKGKGTGMGLPTVIRLVRRHHGYVRLESAVGQGSCFECFFPVEPPSPPVA
jgi:signal transduction histidine kinase/ActR/RegA family two-component response regulator